MEDKEKHKMNIEQLKRNPTVRCLPYDIILMAQQHDPVDALHDIELALEVWREHVDEMLKEKLKQ